MRTTKFWQSTFISVAAMMGVSIGTILLNKKSISPETNPKEKENFIGMPGTQRTQRTQESQEKPLQKKKPRSETSERKKMRNKNNGAHEKETETSCWYKARKGRRMPCARGELEDTQAESKETHIMETDSNRDPEGYAENLKTKKPRVGLRSSVRGVFCDLAELIGENLWKFLLIVFIIVLVLIVIIVPPTIVLTRPHAAVPQDPSGNATSTDISTQAVTRGPSGNDTFTDSSTQYPLTYNVSASLFSSSSNPVVTTEPAKTFDNFLIFRRSGRDNIKDKQVKIGGEQIDVDKFFGDKEGYVLQIATKVSDRFAQKYKLSDSQISEIKNAISYIREPGVYKKTDELRLSAETNDYYYELNFKFA